MTKEEKPKEVTYEELTLSNMYQIEAICRLMFKKKIFNMDEFTLELIAIKKEWEKEKQ